MMGYTNRHFRFNRLSLKIVLLVQVRIPIVLCHWTEQIAKFLSHGHLTLGGLATNSKDPVCGMRLVFASKLAILFGSMEDTHVGNGLTFGLPRMNSFIT